MAFQVSPGVQVKEIDATGVVPAVSTSIGGFAGLFNWGPVGEIVTVGTEKELVSKFGSPDDTTADHFFVAAGFLKYGNALKVVRTEGTGQVSATATGFTAKYPGKLGDSIKVIVLPAGNELSTLGAFAGQFDSAPGTSPHAEDLHGTDVAVNDEMHILVVDSNGLFTGKPDTVLEKYEYVSQGADAKKPDGSTNYFLNILNAQSTYVVASGSISGLTSLGNKIVDTTAYVTTAKVEAALTGGGDATAVTPAQIIAGLDEFADSETVDVNLLFASADEDGEIVVANKLLAMATSRKDCVSFVSPPVADTANASTPGANVKAFVDQLISTSYGVCDSTALYIYDRYNDVYRYINASGHIAGLCANTDNVADAWFSPAGVNRGQMLGVTKLAYNPKQADRDMLYKSRVNPIVSFPGQGTFLYGDKTLLSRPSAFDRINVRRLFIVLEKAISTASKAQLFEFNDEFTRAQFRNMVEPFLRDVKGRRGVTDFRVVCDASNNTGQVIDTNQFVADIFIKPARSINFITLNFIATRTGIEFSEIAGS